MKSIALAMTLVFSTAIFAAQTPATTAVTNLIAVGEYKGLDGNIDCAVTVKTTEDYVSISVTNSDVAKFYTVLNSGINYNVNEVTGEVSASQVIRYPHSMGGGSRVLNIKKNENNEVEFFIADMIIDHRGNDSTSAAGCTIAQ